MPNKTFRRFRLLGGQNSEVNPLIMAEGETELMLNATTDKLGSWQKRLGTRMFGNQSVSGKDILGLHHYSDFAGKTFEPLIVINDSTNTNSDIFRIVKTQLNGAITTATTTITVDGTSLFASSGNIEIEGDLITYTGKTATTLTGVTGITNSHADNSIVRQWKITNADDTQGKKARFANFLDRAIRLNGSNAMKAYNGSTWETTGNPINPNKAATASTYIEVFQSRVFTAGGSSHPDRLYASSLPSTAPATGETTGSITWSTGTQIIDKVGSTGFYIDINPEDGQNITGLERNGNLLLIFKERSLYTWDGNSTQADVLVDIGAISQEAITTINNITFFLGRSKKNLGIYAFTGGYPKLISRKIKRWLDNINQANLVDIVSGADEDHVYFYVGNIIFSNDSIYGTRTFNNVWLVYTLSQDSWSIYDDLHAQAFGYFVSSKAELLVFGDNTGKTFEIGRGQTDDNGEGKTSIDMEIWSGEETFLAPELTKSLQSIEVFSQQAQETEVHFRYDRNPDWQDLGALGARYSYFNAPQRFEPNIGRTLQFQFANNTSFQSQIDGYVLNVESDEEPRVERGTGGRGTRRGNI